MPDMVKIGSKAIIAWLDDEGKVAGEESSYRSAVELHAYLAKKLDEDPNRKDEQLEIYLSAVSDKEDDSKAKFTIAKGKLDEVVATLRDRIIDPVKAMQQLQLVVSQIAELSSMRGIILTTAFASPAGETAAAGFGFISESVDVSDEDIKVLATSAENQAELFKDTMRKKKGIEFPNPDDPDKDLIVTPDQIRGKPNLNVRPGRVG